MQIKILGALALFCFVSVAAAQAPQYREGEQYVAVEPAQPTSVPAGKIEVTEVFSYACPACDHFYPMMDRLRQVLPANAEVDYVAAAFNTSEDWPVFQRAYYTAKALGIAARTHDAMFDAVWKSGQLQTVDPQTQRLKSPMPTIEDVAEWYHRQTGIATQQFLAAAHSFGVDMQIQQAQNYITACAVSETPTIIVNGKYRVDGSSAGDFNRMIEVVRWLVANQAQR